MSLIMYLFKPKKRNGIKTLLFTLGWKIAYRLGINTARIVQKKRTFCHGFSVKEPRHPERISNKKVHHILIS